MKRSMLLMLIAKVETNDVIQYPRTVCHITFLQKNDSLNQPADV